MEEKKIIKNDTGKLVNKLNYTGSIRVSVKKGNRVLSIKNFKNSGRWPLFYFLCVCLAGDYKQANQYRPKYINLFSVGKADTTTPELTDESDLKISSYANETNKETLTTFPYTKALIPDCNSTNIGTCSVTYSFTIPFSHLKDIDAVNKPINLVCLYSDENYADYKNPSAFFFITKEDDKTKLASLIDAEITKYIDKEDTSYDLFIEWKLTINN